MIKIGLYNKNSKIINCFEDYLEILEPKYNLSSLKNISNFKMVFFDDLKLIPDLIIEKGFKMIGRLISHCRVDKYKELMEIGVLKREVSHFHGFINGESFENLFLTDNPRSPFSEAYWKNLNCLDHCSILYAKNYYETLEKKSLNGSVFQTQYWIDRGYSQSDSIVKVSEIQRKNGNSYISKYSKEERYDKTPRRKEYWIKMGYSEVEAIKKVSESQITFSREKCIEKFGYDIGIEKWKQRQIKWQNTLQSRPDIMEINASKDSGSMKWAQKAANGDEELAKKIFEKRNIEKCVGFGTASKQSLLFLIPIYKILRKLGIARKEIYWGFSSSSEYFLKTNSGNILFYDFTVPKINLIIEFHGIKYHPKTPDQDWYQIITGNSAKNIFEKDKIKKEIALSAGFINYFSVFSDETIESFEKIKTAIFNLKFDNNVLL